MWGSLPVPSDPEGVRGNVIKISDRSKQLLLYVVVESYSVLTKLKDAIIYSYIANNHYLQQRTIQVPSHRGGRLGGGGG